METVTRYTVEFRRQPTDPWQEAEPMLPRDERYLPSAEEAEEVLEALKESFAGQERFLYRIDTVEFDLDEWEGMA